MAQPVGSTAAVRDLAEAESWVRRRRAAALVTGSAAVTGDDPRPGRVLLVGGAVAALVVAGAAVVGVLRPAATVGAGAPLGPGLAVDRESGAAYAVLPVEGGLVARPVLNPVSARLLLGAGAVPARAVAPADLVAPAARLPGPALGVPDAPATLPGPEGLLSGGALVCPDAGRTARPAFTASPPDVLGAGTALLVRTGAAGSAWLVVDPGDGARRLPVPSGAAGEPWLAARGVPPLATAVPVPATWLALVPLAPPGAVLPPLAARQQPACLAAVGDGDGQPRLAPVPADLPEAPVPVTGAALVRASATAPVPGGDPVAPAGTWLVDDRGRLLALRGAARERLGYAGVEPVRVPIAWLARLPAGPTLSPHAAGAGEVRRSARRAPP